jgi:hypothetical protein
MVNMGKNLQAALERARVPSAPVQASVPVASAAPTPASGRAKAPSREGKIHIGAYLHPDFKRSLRLVQAQTGEDVQALIAKALNDLFRAHDVPVIDHV